MLEDFTTYTKVDPNNHINIVSGTHIDYFDYMNETAYVYKDFGVNAFNDFVHLIDVKSISSTGVGNDEGCVAVYANDIGGAYTLANASKTLILVDIWGHVVGDPLGIAVSESYGGSTSSSAIIGPLSWNTWYYLKVVKSGTSFKCYIYTDSARTNLFGTPSLTLNGNWNFRYAYPVNNWDFGVANSGEIYVDNYDLLTHRAVLGLTNDMVFHGLPP